jgi:hypothetical protein|tara:strand:+ start:6614 stop:7348 length:735 start_codon:yes stop_codon:yes gene_type:complete
MFGKLKKGINDILTESYSNKKTFKRNFNVLMGSLKGTKTIREFFTLYGEIDKQKFSDKNEARIFLENILSELKSKSNVLIKESRNISNLLEKSPYYKGDTNTIHQKLDTLIFENFSYNPRQHNDIKKELVEWLNQPEQSINETTSVRHSLLVSSLTKLYNKKYSSLSESEKDKLKQYLSIEKETLKEKVDSSKDNLNKLLGNLIKESTDDELKNKLLTVENEVVNCGYRKKDLLRLQQLEEDLS